MANREACEVYIEQEIESGLDKGKTPYAIGKELSDWVAKLFEVRIHPKTIASRVYRHPEFSSNEEKKSQPIDKIEHTTPEIIKDRHPQGGGKREGAGRPSKPKPIEPQKRVAQNSRPTPSYVPHISNAMMYAHMAIKDLESITKKDPERNEALMMVKNYIEDQLREGG